MKRVIVNAVIKIKFSVTCLYLLKTKKRTNFLCKIQIY